MSTSRPTSEDLEVPRDDVDLDIEVTIRGCSRAGLVRVVREGEDRPLDPVLGEIAQAIGTTEQERKRYGELIVELGRAIVDEANELDPVLTMIR